MLRWLFEVERRALWLVDLTEVLLGLAVLERSATALFSALIVEPKIERRPIDAFVGDVDLLEPAADALIPEPEAVGCDTSSVASRDSSFLFVIELSEGLAFKPNFAVEAALPVVAGRRWTRSLSPLPGAPRWLEGIAVAESLIPIINGLHLNKSLNAGLMERR